MRDLKFTADCYKDYINWCNSNPDVFNKINELIKDILRKPFKVLGKPEPLRRNWKGYWSRRITDQHRLIYKIENDIIFFVKCHGHYND